MSTPHTTTQTIHDDPCPKCLEGQLHRVDEPRADGSIVVPLYACAEPACRWRGTEGAIRRRQSESSLIEQCRLEDERRGQPGGGNKSGGRKRQKATGGDKVSPWEFTADLGRTTSSTPLAGVACKVIKVPTNRLPCPFSAPLARLALENFARKQRRAA